jgi:hypothetical protein
MTIKLRPDLILLTRLQVLDRVVRELAAGFGATETELETIRKGIVERQFLSKIAFFYFRNNELVGEGEISIDWDRYTVNVSSKESTFSFDKSRSIAEQTSELYSLIINHVSEMKRNLRVTRVQAIYWFRTGVNAAEVHQFLGTHPTTAPKRNGQYPVTFRVRTGNLNEVAAVIAHDKT